jgi:hypothetical protein
MHFIDSSSRAAGEGAWIGINVWGMTMSYRIIYTGLPAVRPEWLPAEEFTTEHQALGRARELLETGEHHGVAVRDHSGNELFGVRLQLKLGGFSGD